MATLLDSIDTNQSVSLSLSHNSRRKELLRDIWLVRYETLPGFYKETNNEFFRGCVQDMILRGLGATFSP